MDIQLDNLDFYYLRLIDETGQFQEIDLRKELAVNENQLEREMLQQPSKYVYWTSVLERIRLFQDNAELEMEVLMGELDKEAREVLEKPTKDSVEGYIRRTEKYQNQKRKCNYYEYLVRRLNFIVKAFEQRKDMLQSYGKQKANEKVYGQGAGTRQEQEELLYSFDQNKIPRILPEDE